MGCPKAKIRWSRSRAGTHGPGAFAGSALLVAVGIPAVARSHKGRRQHHGDEQKGDQEVTHQQVTSGTGCDSVRPDSLAVSGEPINSTSGGATSPKVAEGPPQKTAQCRMPKNSPPAATLRVDGVLSSCEGSRRASHTATLLGQRGLFHRCWVRGLVDFSSPIPPDPAPALVACVRTPARRARVVF